MFAEKPIIRSNLTARDTRWLSYLAVVLEVAAWRYLPRPWHPTLIEESPHYRIYSTATPLQTTNMARALELLYNAYSRTVTKCAA